MFDNLGRALPIDCRVLRGPRTESVDVTIAHAKDCGNQHRIVNFEIGCAKIACCVDVLGRDMISAELHFSRDIEQRLEPGRDLRVGPVSLHFLDQRFVMPQLGRGNCTMNRLAKEAVVAPGDVRGDHLSLAT